MSKIKQSTVIKSTVPPVVEGELLFANYNALEYVSWFMTDSQNVQNWASAIFRGGIDTRDPRLVDLLAAANKSIKETEDDIAKLKECLAKVIPVNI